MGSSCMLVSQRVNFIWLYYNTTACSSHDWFGSSKKRQGLLEVVESFGVALIIVLVTRLVRCIALHCIALVLRGNAHLVPLAESIPLLKNDSLCLS